MGKRKQEVQVGGPDSAPPPLIICYMKYRALKVTIIVRVQCWTCSCCTVLYLQKTLSFLQGTFVNWSKMWRVRAQLEIPTSPEKTEPKSWALLFPQGIFYQTFYANERYLVGQVSRKPIGQHALTRKLRILQPYSFQQLKPPEIKTPQVGLWKFNHNRVFQKEQIDKYYLRTQRNLNTF